CYDRLCTYSTRAIACASHVRITGEPYEASYGLGRRITGYTVWHSGETSCFRNVMVRWPEERLTVVLLSNRNDPEPYGTALRIGAPFLKPVVAAMAAAPTPACRRPSRRAGNLAHTAQSIESRMQATQHAQSFTRS